MAARRPKNPDEVVMSFGDHLEELRRRLIYALLGVAVVLVVTLWYGRTLIAFIYEPLAEIQRLLDLPTQMYTRSSVSGFSLYLKVTIVAALIVSMPWVLYQMWRFVEAGLYEVERRTASLLMGLSCVMTGLALVFTYYIFLPAMLAFFIFWSTTYPIPETSGHGVLHYISRVMVKFNENTVPGGSQPAAGGGGASASAPATTTAPATASGPAVAATQVGHDLIVPVMEGDPAPVAEGQVWYNTMQNELRIYRGGRIHVITTTGRSMMVPLIDPNEYLGEVMMLTLAIVIVFHVPVVLAVLGLTGLVKPETLAKRRRVIIFCCFIGAIFLTPNQDVFSNVALPVLTWGLFEVGLLFMRYFYNKHHRIPAEEETAAGA